MRISTCPACVNQRAILTTCQRWILTRSEEEIAYGPIRLAPRENKTNALDKLIATHAMALGVTVVTNNMKDFAKYPGVVAENWLMSSTQ